MQILYGFSILYYIVRISHDIISKDRQQPNRHYIGTSFRKAPLTGDEIFRRKLYRNSKYTLKTNIIRRDRNRYATRHARQYWSTVSMLRNLLCARVSVSSRRRCRSECKSSSRSLILCISWFDRFNIIILLYMSSSLSRNVFLRSRYIYLHQCTRTYDDNRKEFAQFSIGLTISARSSA